MPTEANKDYYELLGVSPAADAEVIKAAYRALVSKYHPDKHKGHALEELASAKMAALNEAYAVLSDPSRRADYDARRRGRTSAQPSGASRAPAAELKNVAGLMRVVALVAIGLFALRFVRNWRSLLIIGAAMLLVWFGPRIYAFIKRK